MKIGKKVDKRVLKYGIMRISYIAFLRQDIGKSVLVPPGTRWRKHPQVSYIIEVNWGRGDGRNNILYYGTKLKTMGQRLKICWDNA